MKQKVYIVIILGLSLIASSCKYFTFKNDHNDTEILAKVGDKKLYKNDLKDLYPPNITKDDSLKITNNFVESWARRQIILQKAKFNLTDEQQLSYEEMVKRYKEDLLINNYKEALVLQNIDSVIPDAEIKKFYETNKQIFTLNEDLLRYRMLSYATTSKQAQQMKELFRKNDSISVEKLLAGNFVYQNVILNDSIWINYKDFIEKYPFAQTIDKNQLLQSNQYLELRDDKISHYIQIKSVLRSGESAPLQFVTNDVVKMMFHQKKLKFLEDLENKLIQEAIQNKTYEKY